MYPVASLYQVGSRTAVIAIMQHSCGFAIHIAVPSPKRNTKIILLCAPEISHVTPYKMAVKQLAVVVAPPPLPEALNPSHWLSVRQK